MGLKNRFGDMTCHHYRAFVNAVRLKTKRSVRKHFKKFIVSCWVSTTFFYLFIFMFRLRFLQNVTDVRRDGYIISMDHTRK